MSKCETYLASGIKYPATDLFGYPDSLIRARAGFAYSAASSLMPKDPGMVIDLGSGHGHGSLTINRLLRPRLGISSDRWESFLCSQKIGLSSIGKGGVPEFVGLNLPALPFSKNVFDIIFFIHVMEHLDSPTKSLREILRVLKPGGKLITTTPNGINIAWKNPHDKHTFDFINLPALFNELDTENEFFSIVPDEIALQAHKRKVKIASIPFARDIRKLLARYLKVSEISHISTGIDITQDNFSLVPSFDQRAIDYLVVTTKKE